MKLLAQQELVDLITGCAILGTGGGGSPRTGLSLLENDLKEGHKFQLVDLKEVPDDALIASPYMCGSVSPEKAGTGHGDEPFQAFLALQKYIGQKFFAVIPTEIGGGNTAVALSVAAKLDIPVVDGDPAGRSVPELVHSTFYINNVPIAPLAVASARGEILILKKVDADVRAEAIVRAVAVACGNRVGVADHPIDGKTLKQTVIPGTLSKALDLGRSLREARVSGKDPVTAVVEAGKGYRLFQGKVVRNDWRIHGGFTIGELIIMGEKDFQGHTYRIWYKNEHIIAWFDEEPDVIAPDLLCVLNPTTGEAITNPNCREEMSVVVIGFPAPPIWRTPKGLGIFGPKYFGFDIEYKRIEENKRFA